MKNFLMQLKSPYGVTKSLKWLFDYARNGNYKNPLRLQELPKDKVINSKPADKCLLFVGDLMGTTGKKIIILDELKKWAEESHYVFGNLEGPIWQSKDIVFIKQHNSEERIKELAALAPLNKWVFGLANNHANDYGDEGLENTKQVIEKLGAQWFGTKEKKMINVEKICIWAAATFSNVPTERINFIENLNYETIDKGKYPILFLHWGTEFAHYPEIEQKQMRTHQLSKFKFIIGHHSHTTQPIEFEKEMGTAYSLGNLYVYFNKKILKKGKLLKLYFSGNELCRISWRESEVKKINKSEIIVGLA